jgi:hypothetical protein
MLPSPLEVPPSVPQAFWCRGGIYSPQRMAPYGSVDSGLVGEEPTGLSSGVIYEGE